MTGRDQAYRRYSAAGKAAAATPRMIDLLLRIRGTTVGQMLADELDALFADIGVEWNGKRTKKPAAQS